MAIQLKDETYIWSKVDTEGECWVWRGSNSVRPPTLNWQGRRKVMIKRIIWELVRGPVPEGHRVFQSCDTLHCLRHLFTAKRYTPNRKANERVDEPHARPAKAKKLTPGEVLDEYAHLAPYGICREVIAQRLGMSDSALEQVIGRAKHRNDPRASIPCQRLLEVA